MMNNIIKGIFLLILAISGNFIAETLGCKSQKLLSENMYVKHFVIIGLIYFALGFSSDNEHPFNIAKDSISVYVLFLLFTKMSLPFTILVFMLSLSSYILVTFIEYYDSQDEKVKDKDLINNLIMVKNNIVILMIIFLLIGFSLYFRKQYSDYKKSWSTYKFIFGVTKCNSMK